MKPIEILRAAGGVARWSTLQAAGISERALAKAVAAGEITRVGYGTYAAPRAHPSVVAAVRANGYLWRESAAEFWRLDVLHPPKEPHIVVRDRRRPRSAVDQGVHVVSAENLATSSIPWPVTTVLQTVVDCARVLPFADALVILDSALRNNMINESETRGIADSMTGPGAAAVRRVLYAGDRRSASIGETLVRASALEAGLPRPDLQHKVTFDDGSAAHLDLAWRDYRGQAVKVDVEFDGFSGHGKVDFVGDRRRNNKLVVAGWVRLIYTMPDVEQRYLEIGRQIHQTLEGRALPLAGPRRRSLQD